MEIVGFRGKFIFDDSNLDSIVCKLLSIDRKQTLGVRNILLLDRIANAHEVFPAKAIVAA
jgi:hypothetical protein